MTRRRSRPAKQVRHLFIHARRRAWERYGLDLSQGLYRELVSDIQQGRSTPVRKESGNRSWHKVEHQGAEYLVVYDRNISAISTFLRPEWLEEGGPDSDHVAQI